MGVFAKNGRRSPYRYGLRYDSRLLLNTANIQGNILKKQREQPLGKERLGKGERSRIRQPKEKEFFPFSKSFILPYLHTVGRSTSGRSTETFGFSSAYAERPPAR